MKAKSTFRFPYNVIRNVASPEDEDAGRRRYAGNAPATSYLDLPDDENVRAFLQRTPDGARRKPTRVNRAIRETLLERSDMFGILNSGIVVVASGADVDDKGRVARLTRASIINGSQTQGVLKEWLEENAEPLHVPSVSFELIVTDDEDLIADISIARNYQNDVRDVSIYGRRGFFEELEEAMKKVSPDIALRKSETDFGDDFLDTEKLIQVVTVMAPESIPFPSTDQRGTEESRYRVYAYRHRARCLKDFADVMESDGAKYALTKKFIVDVAPDAWKIYQDLKVHSDLGKAIRSVTRDDKTGRVVDVPDGIVFPVLSALSHFAKKAKTGSWKLEIPEEFDLKDLCVQANHTYTRGAGQNNPNTMGKTAACYHHLHSVVGTFLKYARR